MESRYADALSDDDLEAVSAAGDAAAVHAAETEFPFRTLPDPEGNPRFNRKP